MFNSFGGGGVIIASDNIMKDTKAFYSQVLKYYNWLMQTVHLHCQKIFQEKVFLRCPSPPSLLNNIYWHLAHQIIEPSPDSLQATSEV